ncbi:MAG TPA: DUF4920 domain-containing protein [Calditrichaeota bacterium]|nr:DUF4920 domain-containing protein [Calditrichota bacterium]
MGLILTVNADELPKGKDLGQGITLKDIVKISDILANPDAWVGKKVLVEGQIVDVCKKRGCWMELASDQQYQTIKVKVKDGEIVFPLGARGKKALAEGTVEKIELDMEQTIKYLKHKAEEEGKEFDSKSVTEPLVFYRIKGTGARILQ